MISHVSFRVSRVSVSFFPILSSLSAPLSPPQGASVKRRPLGIVLFHPRGARQFEEGEVGRPEKGRLAGAFINDRRQLSTRRSIFHREQTFARMRARTRDVHFASTLSAPRIAPIVFLFLLFLGFFFFLSPTSMHRCIISRRRASRSRGPLSVINRAFPFSSIYTDAPTAFNQTIDRPATLRPPLISALSFSLSERYRSNFNTKRTITAI